MGTGGPVASGPDGEPSASGDGSVAVAASGSAPTRGTPSAGVASGRPPEMSVEWAARLAQRGVRAVESIAARTALTRQDGPSSAWFDWSANPYRGCEFACGYCYARGTHAWLGHTSPREFHERIYVKDGFAAALRRDLRDRVRPGEHVAFGTATDPYQPAEERHGLMHAALRELLRVSGLRVSITTKSSLVVRDADLLRRVAERHAVQVNLTITTTDARLARFLEPRAPLPHERFEALRRLRDDGVRAGVFLMPVLPGITDADADLLDLAHRAAEARAEFVAHQVVFLEGTSRVHFLASLRRAYPRVAARYEVWTRCSRNLPPDLREDVAERVRRALRDAGITGSVAGAPPVPRQESQKTFEFVA